MLESRQGLRVAVVANRKHSVAVTSDAPPDALAEYDAEETVDGILQALRDAGHSPFFLEADETLLDTVRETRPDICFNIAEGLRGDARESHVPALLEMLGIPYTASQGVDACVSLDKAATKRLWRDSGLPTAPFQVYASEAAVVEGALLGEGLTYPLFVKPVHEGTGMGINHRSIVHTEVELRGQVDWVTRTYRQPALVEPFLAGREFTVGFVGNTPVPGEPRRSDFYGADGFHVFPVLEIDTGRGQVKGIYNTEAKSYAIDSENAPGYLCPADIPAELEAKLRPLAVAAFEAIGGLDVGRVDFRSSGDGTVYLMEINTLPGLNPIVSDIVISARAGGVAYATVIQEILNLALARYGIA